MIRHERVGDAEESSVDLSGVDAVLDLAKIALVAPADLRQALIKTIETISSPIVRYSDADES